MTHPTKTLLSLAAVLGLAACSAPGPRMAAGGDLKAGCESLAGLKIPAERIVWPGLTSGEARVDTATWHAGNPLAVAERGPTPAATITPAAPAHCRVIGRIEAEEPEHMPVPAAFERPRIALPDAHAAEVLRHVQQFGQAAVLGL